MWNWNQPSPPAMPKSWTRQSKGEEHNWYPDVCLTEMRFTSSTMETLTWRDDDRMVKHMQVTRSNCVDVDIRHHFIFLPSNCQREAPGPDCVGQFIFTVWKCAALSVIYNSHLSSILSPMPWSSKFSWGCLVLKYIRYAQSKTREPQILTLL